MRTVTKFSADKFECGGMANKKCIDLSVIFSPEN